MTANEWLQLMKKAADFPEGMETLILKYGDMLVKEKTRWIPTEEDMPEVNKYGYSDNVLTKKDLENKAVVIQQCHTFNGEKIWCDFQTHKFWRPIEIN